MFEESGDVKAAEQAILDIFKEEDKKAREQAVHMFIGSFLSQYHYVRAFSSPKMSDEEFCNRCLGLFDEAEADISSLQEKNSLEKAQLLGTAIGSYLAVVENMAETNHGTKSGIVLVKASGRIASKLKKAFGKKINEKFIQKRIKRIARKNAGKISEQVQLLIAEMAAQFA